MKKSKLIVLLLALVMAMSLLVACGGSDEPAGDSPQETDTQTTGEADTEEADTVESTESVVDDNTLVVAAPEINGSYIDGFGNTTYDVWIKRLIGTHGGILSYNTYNVDENNEWFLNETVVEGEPETIDNEDGTKTYRFKIAENLVWNDETPITAKDYVFSALWKSSPDWMATGASNAADFEGLVGYEAYNSGETDVFEGVNLIDDYTFEITLSADKVPYFFEEHYATVGPTPMHRYTPNLDVDVNKLVVAEGYEISDEDRDNLIESQKLAVEDAQNELDELIESITTADEPVASQEEIDALLEGDYEQALADYDQAMEAGEESELNTELAGVIEARIALDEEEATLAGYEDGTTELDPQEMLMLAAVNDIQYNYRFNPDVTYGAYNFVSFENNMTKVELNPLYVGNAEGKKPTIQNIIVQAVNSTLDVDLAIAGTIDMAAGITQGDKIDKARESDAVNYTEYPRNGYGLLRILNDIGATQHKGVRQAIAYSLDRNEFVQNLQGGYGTVINGAYGISEFEYQARGPEFEAQATVYSLNADAGNAALDTTPYLYEEDGTTPWDPAKAQDAYNADKDNFDYWRYDDQGNRLRVIHNGSTDNEVSDLIEVQLPDNTKLLGMQYIVNPVPFNTLIDNLEFPDENDPDQPTVFNMGVGFGTPHDNYFQYHSSQIGVGDNKERVNDPEADQILENARYIDPDDTEAWLDGWLEFNLWYNENLPNIPLYANQYHDIYTNRVKNVTTTPFHDWSQRICDITIEE